MGTQFINIDSLLIRSAKLLRTIGWFIPYRSDAFQLFNNLFGSITNADPTPFYSISTETTGSAFHRYRGIKTERFGLISTLYRLASFLQITTNTLLSYSKGKENSTLHFQSMMIYFQQILASEIYRNLNNSNIVSMHCHIACSTCITTLPDDHLSGSPHWLKIKFPQVKTEYTWLESDKIQESILNSQYISIFESYSGEVTTLSNLDHIYYNKISSLLIHSITVDMWIQRVKLKAFPMFGLPELILLRYSNIFWLITLFIGFY